jgi:hypothetical protein
VVLGLRYYHCRKNRKIIALNAHGSLLQRHWFVIAVVSNVIQRGLGARCYDRESVSNITIMHARCNSLRNHHPFSISVRVCFLRLLIISKAKGFAWRLAQEADAGRLTWNAPIHHRVIRRAPGARQNGGSRGTGRISRSFINRRLVRRHAEIARPRPIASCAPIVVTRDGN